MSTSKDSGAAFLFIMRLMVDTHMKNMDYKDTHQTIQN